MYLSFNIFYTNTEEKDNRGTLIYVGYYSAIDILAHHDWSAWSDLENLKTRRGIKFENLVYRLFFFSTHLSLALISIHIYNIKSTTNAILIKRTQLIAYFHKYSKNMHLK